MMDVRVKAFGARFFGRVDAEGCNLPSIMWITTKAGWLLKRSAITSLKRMLPSAKKSTGWRKNCTAIWK